MTVVTTNQDRARSVLHAEPEFSRVRFVRALPTAKLMTEQHEKSNIINGIINPESTCALVRSRLVPGTK